MFERRNVVPEWDGERLSWWFGDWGYNGNNVRTVRGGGEDGRIAALSRAISEGKVFLPSDRPPGNERVNEGPEEDRADNGAGPSKRASPERNDVGAPLRVGLSFRRPPKLYAEGEAAEYARYRGRARRIGSIRVVGTP